MQSTQSGTTGKRGWKRAVRLSAVALFGTVVAGLAATGCLTRPICTTDCEPVATNVIVDTIKNQQVDKIDLLFMIDNSASMADKQAVLSVAVPKLVERLVSPYCVNDDNPADIKKDVRASGQKCPDAYHPEFNAINDIHVGIVTSSLGDYGSGSVCPPSDATGVGKEEANDKGELIGSRPRFGTTFPDPSQGANPPVIDKAGFLNWGKGTDVAVFGSTFTAMVKAADEHGCGYEAQLEAIYRFLVDPNPPNEIKLGNCVAGQNYQCAFPNGTDQVVLDQRKAFLRNDSLVAIIMVTDENDCSVKESGQNYLAVSGDTLAPGSDVCAQNPNDPCCYSCNVAQIPSGCAADSNSSCDAKKQGFDKVDYANLRCWHQAARFGEDFLYPTARYVNAFSHSTICPGRDDLNADKCSKTPTPNPLFGGASPRDKALVFFAGIVGVPYQDIQATKNPDTDADYPANELHFKSSAQMAADGTWDMILGDPTNPNGPIPPRDALMIESNQPRQGTNGQGKSLIAPEANDVSLADLQAMPNGHESNIGDRQDLEYACIFPLPGGQTRDCLAAGPDSSCDCTKDHTTDLNPLCTGADRTTQVYAKAYPGIRELQTLKDFGANGIVASICSRNLRTDGEQQQDYGYGPAVDAIIDRLKAALTNKCLPIVLNPITGPDGEQRVPCSIVEAHPKLPGMSTDCGQYLGRSTADPRVVAPAKLRLEEEGQCGAAGQQSCDNFYFCALAEVNTDSCHKNNGDKNTTDPTQIGWCYVDPAHNPRDNPDIVKDCKEGEKQSINFVGQNTPFSGATVLIACFGAQSAVTAPSAPNSSGGSASTSPASTPTDGG